MTRGSPLQRWWEEQAPPVRIGSSLYASACPAYLFPASAGLPRVSGLNAHAALPWASPNPLFRGGPRQQPIQILIYAKRGGEIFS